MKNFVKISNFLVFILISSLLTSCTRDLDADSYLSSSTLNIVLEGQVMSSRDIKIKETDNIKQNTTGSSIGAVSGGLAGAHLSNYRASGVIGGAVLGGVVGAFTEQALGTNHGVEYIVKVDTSKMADNYYEGSVAMRNALAAVKANGIVTVIQSKDKKTGILPAGSRVLVIVSESRTRVVPDLTK